MRVKAIIPTRTNDKQHYGADKYVPLQANQTVAPLRFPPKRRKSKNAGSADHISRVYRGGNGNPDHVVGENGNTSVFAKPCRRQTGVEVSSFRFVHVEHAHAFRNHLLLHQTEGWEGNDRD